MRAYERLLEYVKVKTPSSEENMETPSSSCQFKPVSYTHLTLPTTILV